MHRIERGWVRGLDGQVQVPGDPVQVDQLAVRKAERPVPRQLLPDISDPPECPGPSDRFRADQQFDPNNG